MGKNVFWGKMSWGKTSFGEKCRSQEFYVKKWGKMSFGEKCLATSNVRTTFLQLQNSSIAWLLVELTEILQFSKSLLETMGQNIFQLCQKKSMVVHQWLCTMDQCYCVGDLTMNKNVTN